MLMLKPGAIERDIVGKLCGRFPTAIKVDHLKLTVADHDFLYPHSIGQPWRDRNVAHITGGMSILINVPHVEWGYYRKLALEIRKEFGVSGSDNLIHASDSFDNSVHETEYFFGGFRNA